MVVVMVVVVKNTFENHQPELSRATGGATLRPSGNLSRASTTSFLKASSWFDGSFWSKCLEKKNMRFINHVK